MALKCNILIHQTLKVILSIELLVAVMVHMLNKLMCRLIVMSTKIIAPVLQVHLHTSSYSIPSAYLETCVSCDRLLKQNCVLLFRETDYNMQHEIVKQCIRKKSACGGVKKFICQPCRNSLSKNSPTYPKHALYEKHSCLSCFGSFHQAKIVTFDIANYNCNSNMVKRLLGMNIEQCSGYVCKQCDKKPL